MARISVGRVGKLGDEPADVDLSARMGCRVDKASESEGSRVAARYHVQMHVHDIISSPYMAGAGALSMCTYIHGRCRCMIR